MCRLYGHIAARPLPLAGVLLDAPHSLLTQSCGDWRGEKHRDGWGIGYYQNGKPQVIRRPTAAPEDQEFSASARAISSNIALGHVRQASVGDLCIANAHPFVFGPWLFMHNGTVTGFDKIRAQLVEETNADLRRQVAGTTDSEQVFFWLLSRLGQAGQAPEAACRDVMLVMREMAVAIRTLAEHSAATGPAEPTRLNFVLTDGRVFVASRWKHTLYWTTHAGPLAANTGTPSNPGVMVASEAIGGEPWSEVPDRHILAVDADFVTRWLAI